MFDLIKKGILAGLGVQEKAKEFIEELIKKGEMSEAEGSKAIKDIMERTERNAKELDKRVRETVQKALDKINIPTREDIHDLKKKIETLSAKIKELERGSKK